MNTKSLIDANFNSLNRELCAYKKQSRITVVGGTKIYNVLHVVYYPRSNIIKEDFRISSTLV